MTMPSSSLSTRSLDPTPITACPSAWAALCSSGPPRQTASQALPPESTSRLAHWCANITGWRWTKVARQPTPSRSFVVTPASAERSATDSRRGLASRLSPTHTASNASEASAVTVRSRRSRALMVPRTTARLVRVRPNGERVMTSSPRVLRRPLVQERLHPFLVVVGGAQPRVRLALQLERRVQRRLRAPVEHHLQRPQRQRRALGQLLGERPHGLVEPIVGHRLGDEPPGLRAGGWDPLTGHHEALGAGHTDQAQGPLGAATARDHAEPHFRKLELRAHRRHAEVAGQ